MPPRHSPGPYFAKWQVEGCSILRQLEADINAWERGEELRGFKKRKQLFSLQWHSFSDRQVAFCDRIILVDLNGAALIMPKVNPSNILQLKPHPLLVASQLAESFSSHQTVYVVAWLLLDGFSVEST